MIKALKYLKPINGLLVFIAIIQLMACSPNSIQEQEDPQLDSILKKIHQSDSLIMNRPKFSFLSKEMLDTISDDDLLFTVSDYLYSKLPDDYTKEYETVLTWNKSRQAIFIVLGLEAEVNNGGYNQYYYNSTGQYYKLAPDALTQIGALKYAELSKNANATYEKENKKITKYLDGTMEGFSKSYENNPLNKYDDEFYALEKVENLDNLQIQFIRKHISDFVDK